jgi:hypothetical protein
MTSTSTESWLSEAAVDLVWLVSRPVDGGATPVEVCCKSDILVGIGIPGMSFSAIAFKIAKIEHQHSRRDRPNHSPTHLTCPFHYVL